MELVAVNHWDTAIATHSANHPTARHYIENLETVDPEALVPEGRLDLLMASPECKYHSRARGGKPIHDQGRMQPWAVHNWLSKLDVERVIIENVPEFVDWGPVLRDGTPDKTRKGVYFEAWFKSLWALGYDAEWRMLNAADFGDATTRTRFFLLARKDGRPIVWPEPTHAKPGNEVPMFGQLEPWRAAKEIIDWTDQGRSILDDPKYRKKPLSANTRRRIARGLEKFGGELAPLYIQLLGLDEYSPAGAGRRAPLRARHQVPDAEEPRAGTGNGVRRQRDRVPIRRDRRRNHQADWQRGARTHSCSAGQGELRPPPARQEGGMTQITVTRDVLLRKMPVDVDERLNDYCTSFHPRKKRAVVIAAALTAYLDREENREVSDG